MQGTWRPGDISCTGRNIPVTSFGTHRLVTHWSETNWRCTSRSKFILPCLVGTSPSAPITEGPITRALIANGPVTKGPSHKGNNHCVMRCYVMGPLVMHCRDKMPKIWNKYSQKRNIGASVPISVSELYIPTMGLPFLLEKICGPILGIYKSLTEKWMWKLGLRPRNSQKSNI